MGKNDNDNVSTSRKNEYDKCERHAFIFDKRRLGYLTGKYNAPMRRGVISHKMLELSVEIGGTLGDLVNFDDAYIECASIYSSEMKLVEKARNIIQQYIRFISYTKDNPVWGYTIKALEVYFNDQFSGVIDVEVEDEDGNLWGVDYKTISYDTETLVQASKVSQQFQLYQQANNYKGMIVIGMRSKQIDYVPNELKNGSLSVSHSAGNSYEQFTTYLYRNDLSKAPYRDYISWLKDNPSNVVQKIQYNEYQINNTMKRLHKSKERIQSIKELDDCIPRFTFECKDCVVLQQCTAMEKGEQYSLHGFKNRKTDIVLGDITFYGDDVVT